MHIPVMTEEILALFAPCHLKKFVDATVGMGGHARLLLQHHPEITDFYAVDCDEMAIDLARKALKCYPTVHYLHANFADIEMENVDGMLIDLGVSSLQLDLPERGFSFSKEGPLDMRMDQSQDLTAEHVVNNYSERELARIFFEYGEERRGKRAAAAIVFARKKKRITTTSELTEILRPHLGWQKRHFNPMTLIFQALRIEVNGELTKLAEALERAILSLRKGGRLAVISFHSLEDRIVKQLFRQMKEEGHVEILTKKPLVPTLEEERKNPRSRSAKLRALARW